MSDTQTHTHTYRTPLALAYTHKKRVTNMQSFIFQRFVIRRALELRGDLWINGAFVRSFVGVRCCAVLKMSGFEVVMSDVDLVDGSTHASIVRLNETREE